MDKFFNQTLQKLETAINDIEIETPCSIERIEAVIHLIIDCLLEIKEYVLENGFKNVAEEIRFFKYQKPVIVAKLIYYNEIYKIDGDIRVIAKYFEGVFNTELGNFYQTYLELRNRKMSRTKFLDSLREGLIRKMDEQDEK